MKIRCDFCNEEAASVFCSADEAALCSQCDFNVHSANLLSRKHKRFSIINPSSNCSDSQSPPLCDICKEKRGFLFCQEDRAILCRDCDISIHKANAHTMKHSRFLLGGNRLSSDPIAEPELKPESSIESNHHCKSGFQVTDDNNSSSISEYLINLLPGWHVEDFLNDEVAYNNCSDASSNLTWMATSDVVDERIMCIGGEKSRNDQFKRLGSDAFMVPEVYGMGQISNNKKPRMCF